MGFYFTYTPALTELHTNSHGLVLNLLKALAIGFMADGFVLSLLSFLVWLSFSLSYLILSKTSEFKKKLLHFTFFLVSQKTTCEKNLKTLNLAFFAILFCINSIYLLTWAFDFIYYHNFAERFSLPILEKITPFGITFLEALKIYPLQIFIALTTLAALSALTSYISIRFSNSAPSKKITTQLILVTKHSCLVGSLTSKVRLNLVTLTVLILFSFAYVPSGFYWSFSFMARKILASETSKYNNSAQYSKKMNQFLLQLSTNGLYNFLDPAQWRDHRAEQAVILNFGKTNYSHKKQVFQSLVLTSREKITEYQHPARRFMKSPVSFDINPNHHKGPRKAQQTSDQQLQHAAKNEPPNVIVIVAEGLSGTLVGHLNVNGGDAGTYKNKSTAMRNDSTGTHNKHTLRIENLSTHQPIESRSIENKPMSTLSKWENLDLKQVPLEHLERAVVKKRKSKKQNRQKHIQHYHAQLTRQGLKNSWTPQLDRLAAQGIWFDNFYYTVLATQVSVMSILLGLPVWDYDVYKQARAQPKHSILDFINHQQKLKKQPLYRSVYMKAGHTDWADTRRFMTEMNFNPIIGSEDFNLYQHSWQRGWAVSDADLFSCALGTMLQHRQDQSLFLQQTRRDGHKDYKAGRIRFKTKNKKTFQSRRKKKHPNKLSYCDYAYQKLLASSVLSPAEKNKMLARLKKNSPSRLYKKWLTMYNHKPPSSIDEIEIKKYNNNKKTLFKTDRTRNTVNLKTSNQKDSSPLFMLLLTISIHEPLGEAMPAHEWEHIANPLERSTRYQDYVLGQFIHKARKILGPNTIYIITADHAVQRNKSNLEYSRIPLVILDDRNNHPDKKAMAQGRRISKVGSHADLATTLAYMLPRSNLTQPQALHFIGRNLFDTANPGLAISLGEWPTLRYHKGNFVLHYNRATGQGESLWRAHNDPLFGKTLHPIDHPDLLKSMTYELKAYMYFSKRILLNGNYR